MKFQDFQLDAEVLKTLAELKITVPTSIQEKMLPLVMKDKNIIVAANTGTGKTLGYILTIISKLDLSVNKTQALVIIPTRELAVQIYEVCQRFKKNLPQLKVVNLIGGQDINNQKEKFKDNNQPHLVIGTPTRLKLILDEQILKLTTSKIVVLDEVDMIFDLDFINDVDFILSKLATTTQLMVFSATIDNNLQSFLKKYLKNATIIDNINYKIQNNIKHFLVKTKHHNRLVVLKRLLTEINPFLCLIFINKKNDLSETLKLFHDQKIKVGQLHSSLKSRERIKMLKRVNDLEFQYVICSDIASRGIDLPGVSHVISLNLPHDLAYYFHRAGRGGRGKYEGSSYLFYDTDDEQNINFLIKKGIQFESWPPEKQKPRQKWDQKKRTVVDINDFNKIAGKYHSRPVKPGYKKERQTEMKKMIQKKYKKSLKK